MDTFNKNLLTEYQNEGGKLRDKIMNFGNIAGKNNITTIAQELQAYERERLEPAVIKEAQYRKISIAAKEFRSPYIIDPKDKDKLSFNEIPTITSNIKKALQRKVDDEIFSTMLTGVASTTNVIAGANNESITLSKLLKIKKIFQEKYIDDNERYLLIPSSVEIDLFYIDEIKNNDYVNKGAIASGAVGKVLGINIIVYDPTDSQMQYTKTGDYTNCIAFGKRAFGYGYVGYETESKIWNDDDRRGIVFDAFSTCGSMVCFEDAIIRVECQGSGGI